MARARLRRVALALGLTLALLVLGEVIARSSVPANGTTPFQIGSLDGLASELRPGFETHYRGHAVRINSDGFRGPPTPARAPEVLRVALVGDSFTFGNGVAWEHTLGVQLERELERAGRPAQVLNCGVPGYNAEHVALLACQRALELDPDVLVYVFFANDIDAGAKRVEVPGDAQIDPYAGFPLGSALGQWLAVHLKRGLATAGLDVDRRAREYRSRELTGAGGRRLVRALEDMRACCGERGVRFEVAVYPFLAPPEANAFGETDAFVAAACAERSIVCTELLAAFGPDPDLYAYWSSVWDSHPSAAGHALAAGELARSLLER